VQVWEDEWGLLDFFSVRPVCPPPQQQQQLFFVFQLEKCLLIRVQLGLPDGCKNIRPFSPVRPSLCGHAAAEPIYGYVCNKETEDEIFFENVIFQNQPELAIDSLKCCAPLLYRPAKFENSGKRPNKNDPIRPSSSHENENKKRTTGLAEC
jgi:hypothetical protein